MKNMKRLTRRQKILVAKKGLHPGSYLLAGEDDATLTLYDKSVGIMVTVPKE